MFGDLALVEKRQHYYTVGGGYGIAFDQWGPFMEDAYRTAQVYNTSLVQIP
jgi:hypothetical protein